MDVKELLDCVGLKCPMPIVQTMKTIKRLETGEVLEVVSDDEGIVQDMPAWCASTGNECLGVEEMDGEWHAFVKKQ